VRTDAQLQQDVSAELRWEPSVCACLITVAVHDAVVSLTGEVSSYAQKCHTERAARRVAGVRVLAVDLTIKLSALAKRTDADIARFAQNAVQCSASIPKDAINVLVEGGRITLSGAVSWQYQKQAALDAVQCLLGVTGVSDQIALKPALPVGAVKAQIEAALRRGAYARADAIRVDVDGTAVTLSGTVHSWSERELATNSAWGAAGVHKVVDNLTLADGLRHPADVGPALGRHAPGTNPYSRLLGNRRSHPMLIQETSCNPTVRLATFTTPIPRLKRPFAR
jgi:osmotically-inducible protein OsmY